MNKQILRPSAAQYLRLFLSGTLADVCIALGGVLFPALRGVSRKK